MQERRFLWIDERRLRGWRSMTKFPLRTAATIAAVTTAPACGGQHAVSDGAKPKADPIARPTCDGAPVLAPGEWKNITPPGLDLKSKSNHSYGANDIQIDPANPCVLYASFDMRGLFRSANAGATWTKIGSLDSPLHLRIDPHDSRHIYAVDGVRGMTQGFWVSRDAGRTWTIPDSFSAVAKSKATFDTYYVDVDPADFNHLLVTSHGDWADPSGSDTGILESKDGGVTWTVVFQTGWSKGDCAWFMSSSTWLLGTQAHGYFRTTDAGKTWSPVYPIAMTHGGVQLYHSPTGAYYAGALEYPIVSADDGATWKKLDAGLPKSSYAGIVGDGRLLYTSSSCACDGEPYDAPYFTAPERDGAPWSAYRGGAQKFKNGSYNMAFDKVRRVLYSANWEEGLWALNVADAH